MKIPEGRELAAQVLVSLFVFVVSGIAVYVAFQAESPAVMIGALIGVLGLVFLFGLRLAGRAPGD